LGLLVASKMDKFLRSLLPCKSSAKLITHYAKSFNLKLIKAVIQQFNCEFKNKLGCGGDGCGVLDGSIYNDSKNYFIYFLKKYFDYFDTAKGNTDIFDYVECKTLPINMIYYAKNDIYQLNIDFLDLFVDKLLECHLGKFFCSKYCVMDLYDASYIISKIVPWNHCKIFFKLKCAYLLYRKYRIVPVGFLGYSMENIEKYSIDDIFNFFETFLFRKVVDGFMIVCDNGEYKYTIDNTNNKITGVDFLPIINIIDEKVTNNSSLNELIDKYTFSKYSNIEINIKILKQMMKLGKDKTFIITELLAIMQLYVFGKNIFDKFYEFII